MTTNQAFIKAYRQDSAQPSPARPASLEAARPSAAVLATSVEYVSSAAGHFAATYDTHVPITAQQLAIAANEGAATPERARLPVGVGQVEDLMFWPKCDTPFGRIDTPSPPPSPSGKRPLSAFTGQRAAATRRAVIARIAPTAQCRRASRRRLLRAGFSRRRRWPRFRGRACVARSANSMGRSLIGWPTC